MSTALTDTLRSTLAAHRELLELVREHRRALASVDGPAIARTLEAQSLLRARLGDLDRRRVQIIRQLTATRPGLGVNSALADVAALLPEREAAEVLTVSRELRDVLEAIRRESSIVDRAGRALLSHVDGIMQGISRSLDRVRTYAPTGRLAPSRPAVCGVDVLH